MNPQPDFLPPMINLDGLYEEIIERLYQVFHRDFIENSAKHLGWVVRYNGNIYEYSQGKVEGFWHVITRQDATKVNRLIDYQRAKRLPWAKPLIENPFHNELKFFIYEEDTLRKGIRHYIWFEKGNYVVVLRKRRDDYFWITAFFVEDWKKSDLQRRYKNRIGP